MAFFLTALTHTHIHTLATPTVAHGQRLLRPPHVSVSIYMYLCVCVCCMQHSRNELSFAVAFALVATSFHYCCLACAAVQCIAYLSCCCFCCSCICICIFVAVSIAVCRSSRMSCSSRCEFVNCQRRLSRRRSASSIFIAYFCFVFFSLFALLLLFLLFKCSCHSAASKCLPKTVAVVVFRKWGRLIVCCSHHMAYAQRMQLNPCQRSLWLFSAVFSVSPRPPASYLCFHKLLLVHPLLGNMILAQATLSLAACPSSSSSNRKRNAWKACPQLKRIHMTQHVIYSVYIYNLIFMYIYIAETMHSHSRQKPQRF